MERALDASSVMHTSLIVKNGVSKTPNKMLKMYGISHSIMFPTGAEAFKPVYRTLESIHA